MPVLADLCDKSCFARKFAWLGKRNATIAPVQPKVHFSCVSFPFCTALRAPFSAGEAAAGNRLRVALMGSHFACSSFRCFR
jgi:hypothetical protein